MNERGNLEPKRLRATFRKITSVHNRVPDILYTGVVGPLDLAIGHSFVFNGWNGWAITSPVLVVRKVGVEDGMEVVRFRTKNSEYELRTEEVKQLEWKEKP